MRKSKPADDYAAASQKESSKASPVFSPQRDSGSDVGEKPNEMGRRHSDDGNV